MTIGGRIKKRRTDLGLTLEDVARRSGVSRQTIQRYESGVISNIPSDRIEMIAESLSVSPAYLMGWIDSENRLKPQDVTIPQARNLSILKDMDITVEEIQIVSRYRCLDTHGKEMVDFTLEKEYQRSIANVEVLMPDKSYSIPVAAHERTDIEVTDEMRKHDDDIMNDDNF